MGAVVIYELRHGAESCANPAREHARLDQFLEPYDVLPFDTGSALECARLRRALERLGTPIGPYDLQIAAMALQHRLNLVTHNTAEFARVPGLLMEDWES